MPNKNKVRIFLENDRNPIDRRHMNSIQDISLDSQLSSTKVPSLQKSKTKKVKKVKKRINIENIFLNDKVNENDDVGITELMEISDPGFSGTNVVVGGKELKLSDKEEQKKEEQFYIYSFIFEFILKDSIISNKKKMISPFFIDTF